MVGITLLKPFQAGQYIIIDDFLIECDLTHYSLGAGIHDQVQPRRVRNGVNPDHMATEVCLQVSCFLQ